ncbi:MAG: TIGR02391 family protein [bacterium]|nr:TIGR02391 family protein [bacterium]
MLAAIPPIGGAELEAICAVLADTHTGLTGSEIGRLLSQAGIADLSPTMTKRDRLYGALFMRQQADRCANNVLAFIQAAMKPVRYVDNRASFEIRRTSLNQTLAFCGLELREDGTLIKVQQVHTLSEADQRATKLKSALIERRVHPDVLKFCRAELLQDNYFHAVFEAAKSVAQKIREKSELDGDGSQLVDSAFAFGASEYPLLAFNPLRSETERGEHRGLMNLLKGLFGTFRNTLAHAPKISWPMGEQDALDILSLCSLLHRRLDQAVRTGLE